MSNSSTVAKESQVSETTAENIGTNVVPRATSATSLPVESKSIEDNVSEENQLPLDTDTQRSTDTTNNATTTKTQKNSLIDEKEPRDTDIGTESTLAQQSDDEQEESNSMRNDVKTAQEDKDDSETFEETMSEAENKRTPEFPVFDEENDDFTISNDETNVHDNDDDFDEFGEFNDEFVDATPNAVGDDDDFGDFDDFEQTPDVLAPEKDPTEKATILEEDAQSNTPTAVELYIDVMMNRPNEVKQFMTNYLTQLWKSSRESEQERDVLESEEPAETLDMDNTSVEPNILATASSQELWDKLSRDTVFYNSVTGSVGQFQWTRSEINRAYLHALGVTFSNNYNNTPSYTSSPTIDLNNNASANFPTASKKRHSNIYEPKRSATISATHGSSPNNRNSFSPVHTRSASSSGNLSIVTTNIDESAQEAKKEAVQELELDIDIARAYCDLTEETIRVFPDVKLKTMVDELTRLQKQAADYLENLLDQQEQLKMDAETYNDLISCIVGHAQRLHVQNKDASPAMVSKKKKSGNGTFSNLMRRKTTIGNTAQSVSMGGGVVGVKQQQQHQSSGPTPNKTISSASQQSTSLIDNRRSM